MFKLAEVEFRWTEWMQEFVVTNIFEEPELYRGETVRTVTQVASAARDEGGAHCVEAPSG